ncbi:MAG: ATP synthase subunit I [Thermodesulfobacteriota bacterium]|nr:ATP synthase subunit I [Thermodesulfobacteriota bacterium]
MSLHQRIIKFITRSNWYLFTVTSLLGIINTPHNFAMGILCGGLLVTVNFHLLQRTLTRILDPLKAVYTKNTILRTVLVKYYIRFALSGLIIYLLISKNIVDPLGLLAGLSVVVASIMAATMFELTKLIIKEAV